MLSQGNNRLKEGNMWITLFKEKGVDLSKNILVTSTYNEKKKLVRHVSRYLCYYKRS